MRTQRRQHDGSTTGAAGPRAGYRSVLRPAAAVLVAGSVLVLAACTSGGSSLESASTPAASSPGSSTGSPSTSGSPASGPVTSGSSSSGAVTGGSSTGPSSSAVVPGGAGNAAGAAYCEGKGGQVQTRDATFGTNGPPTSWLPLAGTTQVCRFQADDEARSRIYVDLATVTSARPTLAGLAYLARTPMPASSGGANPATGYCTKLGGSSTFGQISASGGGWVNKDDPDDVVVALCVFPDLSFIDEWGLAYHSGGVVRGRDLTQVMTYQPPDPLPGVFPVGTATVPPTTASTAPGGSSSSGAGSAAPTS